MSAQTYSVVEGGTVIVTPRKPPEQIKFRFDPDLIQGLRDLAERTNRSLNEVGEMLMMWALERATEELARAGDTQDGAKRKKAQP